MIILTLFTIIALNSSIHAVAQEKRERDNLTIQPNQGLWRQALVQVHIGGVQDFCVSRDESLEKDMVTC